ncbi:Histone-Lysine N-Methyltransferase ash1l, partial [Bulinus truncatus]
MKDMSQDGITQPSIYNSPNGVGKDEFCIGSSSIDNGGLKLTISCRKRNYEDVQDHSIGTNLSIQKKNQALSDKEHPSIMEKQTPEIEMVTDESILSVTTNSLKELSNSENQPDIFMPPVVNSKSFKLMHLKSSSIDKQDSALFVSTQNDGNISVSKPGSDILKSHDAYKPYKRFKQDGSVHMGSLHDVHDPLFRLDTLPSVSPDSGIISLDESPFGNESPNSVLNGDLNSEHTQIPSSNFAHLLSKKTEQSSPGMILSEDVKDSLEANELQKNKENCESERLERKTSYFEDYDANSSINSNKISHINSVEKLSDEVSDQPSLSNTSCVIVSSPHKISLAMGRKKRGRPPKKNNALLLRHKKSTLYSGLYSSVVTSAENKNISVGLNRSNSRHNIEQLDVKNISGLLEKRAEAKNNNNIRKISNNKNGKPRRPLSTSSISSSFHKTHQNISQRTQKVKLNKVANHISRSLKRPRGRPRKNLDSGEELGGTSNDKSDVDNTIPLVDLKDKGPSSKPIKKKHFRKRLFTQRKKKNCLKSASSTINLSVHNKLDCVDNINDECIDSSQITHKFNLNTCSASPEKKTDCSPIKYKPLVISDKSVFQDSDLDAILKSVKSSITNQFANEEHNSDIISNISFDNPFKVTEPPPFPKLIGAEPPKVNKPKPKKTKLHVMMRRNKRKKRKKTIVTKTETPTALPPPKKLEVFSNMIPLKKMDKFSFMPQKKCSSFGSLSDENRLSFFTSCSQPSKILATSRLNVFRSGTGVDESHNSGIVTDIDQSDFFDKRNKKRHRLLYRKSKHKNIIDPMFAADLDTLVSGLNGMAISENPADNYIRVRPGEMPLPSIFRVIKIDLNKSKKDRVLSSEVVNSERGKPRKETPAPYEISTGIKPIPKGARKKSVSDQISDVRDFSSICDSHDQCLPPKKRHRLVHLESSQFNPQLSTLVTENVLVKKDFKVQRKCRRTKKSPCWEENKYCDKTSRLNKQLSTLELTIDTSSFTTGGSSACVSPLSPCPSRLSTRSSTHPSLSSPSPTGSAIYRNRHYSKNNLTLTCPLHSLSSYSSDHSTCPECQLLDQCISPNSNRSYRTNLRSAQISEANYSSERYLNGSESNPSMKDLFQQDRGCGRSAKKRRKSVTLSADESDSSPPRLEKNSSLSPLGYRDLSFFSDPPEITNSPFKGCLSPQRHNSGRCLNASVDNMCTGPLSPKKNLFSQRTLRQVSPNKVSPQSRKTCNKTSSTSVISFSNSDHEPLPLEQCSIRSIFEEIQTSLAIEKVDSELSSDESVSPGCNIPAQLPRKRFQRVGLFSDFYKDDEPRKRCENMVKCREKLHYVKDEHEYGLMPQPLHIGQYYMRKEQDFELPYDMWWQHAHNQLPKKQEHKLKFRNIRTNVYSDSKVSSRKLEIPLCNCVIPPSGGKGCQDDCLNRMIYTECTPSTCSLGDNCDNQKIQRHEWVQGLEKFVTKDRGFGVRTKSFIKNGYFILEYLGEVVSEIEFRRRMMEEYSEECHHYALHLDSGSVIDGYRMGNIGRYVNHSCKPNCEMQKWNVNGLYRMVLFALRDIMPGEELSYDYNFDPFNQETQQECRCGSSECRGVIGGKTQRTNGSYSKPEKLDDPKDKRKSKLMNKKMKEKQTSENMQVQFLAKPMTFKERCYARKHHIFLVRNVDKVRNQKHPGQDLTSSAKEELNIMDCNKINTLNPDLMLAHLNERSVKTRLAAYAKDNPEMAKRHQLAQIFDKMLTELLSLKDEDGDSLVTQLMTLPSRKKQPQYYQVVRDPIDLSMIKQKVKTGYYDHLSAFNADLMLLFSNVELYCGPKSDMGQIILKLRRVLNCVKAEVASQIDELLGPKTTKTLMDTELEKLEHASCKGSDLPEEDIIRCICGVTRDEGLMLQCEKCLRWQHCDCVRASGNEEHYLCDRCEPRYHDPEILLIPQPADALPDCTHYMTLIKDDVQYAIGDCVYVMRDCKRTSTGTPLRSSHRLLASVNPDKLDIFRLEQLWKDPKGEKFASGTPYLRPQETFHEPTRKFYHNELFRTPNFEIIPMDLVMGKCIVMDTNTYCKGRPKGVKEQDIYICEYRVDKTAHLFHKIQKIWYPINTGRFCFDWFKTRLNIRRTYLPHEVPEEYKRKTERVVGVPCVKIESANQEDKKDAKKILKTKANSLSSGKVKIDESIKNDMKLKAEVKVNVKKGNLHRKAVLVQKDDLNALIRLMEKKRKEKRQRLDKILTRLLNNIPGKQKIDLTYLLDERKRVRKK